VLRDPVALGEVLDEWIQENEPMRRARRALLSREKALRTRCNSVDPSGTAWRLFLRIDLAHVDRLVDALNDAVLWAFNQGRRWQRTRGVR
jgi:hypothetical protein